MDVKIQTDGKLALRGYKFKSIQYKPHPMFLLTTIQVYLFFLYQLNTL